MNFLSPEVALYLYKSTILSHMEYCCDVWDGAASCYLKLLDKLQKWICRTVSLWLAASIEPLAHCENVASLSRFCRYYFGRCSSELPQLVPLPYSQFLMSLFWDVTTMSMSTVSLEFFAYRMFSFDVWSKGL